MIVFVKSSAGVVEAGSATPGGAAVLQPNGTAWLSVTFQVLVACPSPLPVQFSVSYQENGRTDTAQLPGFPNLGQVTYTGCKGGS
jgi:nicotinamide mononucleotide (NMN) deamidase PncC